MNQELFAEEPSPKKITCLRKAMWLEAETNPILVNYHLPQEQSLNETGVVICPPFGYEYTHSHRSLRHLADILADQGFACARFDYHGTGDSFSDLHSPERIETFKQNIHSVINHLKQQSNVKKIVLIGIRLGATLAAAYCAENNVEQLVLWAPCIKGRAYVRELEALEKLASHSDPQIKNKPTKEFLDSGGFIISNETSAALTQINLLKQHYHVSESILVVDREEAQNGQKLVETLNEIKIPLVERMVTAGYNGMMAEPQNTKVPFETLYKIKDWLLAQNPKQQSTSLSIENFNNANIAQCTKEDISETICFDPESHLMGILCQSLSAPRKEHLIIFTNSGAVHRVGPNRIYTELTRALAQAGFPNVRFDMSNLGDSFNGVSQEENDPYPAGSTQDITLFIDFMQRQHGFKTISLAGLCSGAHNSFHTALESPDLKSLKEIIMINPLAFYRRKGAEIFNASNQELARDAEQYRKSLLSPTKWKKVFSGQTDFKYLAKFALNKSFHMLRKLLRKIAEKLNLVNQSQLAEDLQLLQERDLPVNFFIASKDPGRQLLFNEAAQQVRISQKSGHIKIYDIENADHTFSTYASRQKLIAAFVRHMTERYS